MTAVRRRIRMAGWLEACIRQSARWLTRDLSALLLKRRGGLPQDNTFVGCENHLSASDAHRWVSVCGDQLIKKGSALGAGA
jgi:hypothetical protein